MKHKAKARRAKMGAPEILAYFRERGGILTTSQAQKAGIHQRTIYRLRDTGELDQLSRGLYRLAGAPPLSNPDLVAVALRVPRAVICLLSALAYHDLTTQVPHEVQIAMERNMLIPRLNYPPIRVFRFSRAAFAEGAESHEIDGVPMRIYSPEKTLADCFKFRNKIGLDTVIESLRLYRERRKIDVGGLMRFAAVCRVAKAMRPYLESLL